MYSNRRDEESEKSGKKTNRAEQGVWLTIMVAVVTALSSTGMIGLFDVFDDDGGGGFFGGSDGGASAFITARTRSLVVDLKGEWSFSVGDDSGWAESDFDSSGWSKVGVPGTWESEGYRDYDGYAWYRRSFGIEESDTDKAIYAYLGRIDDVDEVFVNGVRIGGKGRFLPEYVTAWDEERVYRIPEGVLRAGSGNTMAVRVFDAEQGGGIVDGRVGLYASSLPQPLIDLSGDWRFFAGDNLGLRDVDFDASGLGRINVPSVWEEQGYDGYDGFAWYRKEFGRLAVSTVSEMVLLLGKIDDTDEVYLNGELVGRTGALDGTDRETNSNFYRENRVYSFSSSLLRERNVLAVRVRDDMGFGGIYEGALGIMSAEAYEGFKVQLEESKGWGWSDTMDWLMGRE